MPIKRSINKVVSPLIRMEAKDELRPMLEKIIPIPAFSSISRI
jgi:hypothetical protein